MSLGRFILWSLSLSFWVFLRTMPIIIAVAFVIFAAIWASLSQPIVTAMVSLAAGVLFTPFIHLTGIRAGLVALDETDAPAPERLLGCSMRMLFMQMLPSTLLTLLLSGLGILAVFGALFGAAPDLFEAFDNPDSSTEAAQTVIRMLPMLYFILFLAVSVSTAVFAVPMAATAANAVRKSPGYDFIYGMAQQFLPVFTVTFLVYAVPNIVIAATMPVLAFAMAKGDPALMTTTMGIGVGVPLAIYTILTLYAPFILWAAIALAFAVHREEHQQRREIEQAAVFGELEPEEDRLESLRDLRRARGGGGSSGAAPGVYLPERGRAAAPRRDDPPDTDNVFKDDDDDNIFK